MLTVRILTLLVVGCTSYLPAIHIPRPRTPLLLSSLDDADADDVALNDVWISRRKMIRQTLENSSKVRSFKERVSRDENSDGKIAVGVTAAIAAVSTITLRLGGRAALVSGLGLDMFGVGADGSSDLATQINDFLAFTGTLPPYYLPLIYLVGWITTKVTMIDFLGIILAFSSGVIFHSIFLGGLISATFATIGSTIAFTLSRLDTPIRRKVLESYQDNPALKGIERAIENDGVKTVLTLRLAPVVPIPIGTYSYAYGLTNLRYWEFVTGIFLGSLKPYFLDSYLGYYGEQLIVGGDSGNDFVIVGVLAVTTLVGVFASQIATTMWTNVMEEMENNAEEESDGDEEEEEDIFVGLKVKLLEVGFIRNIATKIGAASDRLMSVVEEEIEAARRGETIEGDDVVPNFVAKVENANDLLEMTTESLVLSPLLWKVFFEQLEPPEKSSSSNNT